VKNRQGAVAGRQAAIAAAEARVAELRQEQDAELRQLAELVARISTGGVGAGAGAGESTGTGQLCGLASSSTTTSSSAETGTAGTSTSDGAGAGVPVKRTIVDMSPGRLRCWGSAGRRGSAMTMVNQEQATVPSSQPTQHRRVGRLSECYSYLKASLHRLKP
jgi:hypothetical protein